MTAKGIAKTGGRLYNGGNRMCTMKTRLLTSLCCAALLGLAACTSQKKDEPVTPTPTPTQPTQPTQPAQPTPNQPEQKPVQQPTAPVVNGKSAAETRKEAAAITPAAPGARVSRVQVPGMYVALTFDDGPSAALTPQVLNILNRHNARGTFFVLGENANRNRGIIARAASEGHEVGVHTWSHIKMTSAGTEKINSEISRTAEVIKSATGKTPRVMRPPYGATNKNIVAHMYNDYGMYSILWDVDTLDWKHPGVQKVINTAVSQAKPGSIILVHDIHASTLAALEGIVTGLQARGFKLVTVSQLMALARQASGAGEPARQQTAPAAPLTPAEPAAPAAEPVVPVAPLAPVAAAEQPAAPAAESAPADVSADATAEGAAAVSAAPAETPAAPAEEAAAL